MSLHDHDPTPWFADQCHLSRREAYQWRIALSTGATPGPRPNTVLAAMKWFTQNGVPLGYVKAVRESLLPHLDYVEIELLYRGGVPAEYVIAGEGYGAPGIIALHKAGVPLADIERESRPSPLYSVAVWLHEAGVPASYSKALLQTGYASPEIARMWRDGVALDYALELGR